MNYVACFSDIGDATDDVIVLNVSLMRYFDQVAYCIPEMSSEQRDFLLCAILTWLQVRERCLLALVFLLFVN